MFANTGKAMGILGAIMILGATGMASEAEARGKGGKSFHGGGHRATVKFHGGGGHRFKHFGVKHHVIRKHRHRHFAYYPHAYVKSNYCLEYGWRISPYGHKRWSCLAWAY